MCFTSIAADAIGIIVLLLVYPAIPMRKLIGSDIAHAVPLTLMVGISHWAGGYVDAPVLLSLLTGAIPGISLDGS